MLPSPIYDNLTLPSYLPPGDSDNPRLRSPVWVWRRDAIAASSKDLQQFAVLPTSTVQDVARLIDSVHAYAEAAAQFICVRPGPKKAPLFTFDGFAAETPGTWTTLFRKCVLKQQKYKDLLSLRDQCVAEPENAELFEALKLAYRSWNPVEWLTLGIVALFRSEEAKYMLWTAQSRWHDMARGKVLEEWRLILEDSDMMAQHDHECYLAALSCIRGSLAVGELRYAATFNRRAAIREFVNTSESVGAGIGTQAVVGAGTDASASISSPPVPVHATLFYHMIAAILEYEDLFGPGLEDHPLKHGWIVHHADMILINEFEKGGVKKPETKTTFDIADLKI